MPLQEVHSDWQLFGKAKFTVTAVSANTALGTVVPLNDLTFEAKPAENAAVSGWSLQPEGAAAVAQDGNVFTVSDVREDCTLVVEFRQRVPATVVFSTPEGASQPMQRGYVGEEMALTAPEGKPLANAHDYVFAGWTDAPVADAVQVSTVYTDTYTPSAPWSRSMHSIRGRTARRPAIQRSRRIRSVRPRPSPTSMSRSGIMSRSTICWKRA